MFAWTIMYRVLANSNHHSLMLQAHLGITVESLWLVAVMSQLDCFLALFQDRIPMDMAGFGVIVLEVF